MNFSFRIAQSFRLIISLRFFQVLLIGTFLPFCWLFFMVVHEFGHVLAGWLTGGSVSLVVLHPLKISWTLFSENPHPQLAAWGGPALGAALPVLFFFGANRLRLAGFYLFRFFAGFCLIANGLYLFIDSFGRGGDGGTLLRNGAAQWELLGFGLLTVPLGFWLWHGLGPHFGLGKRHGRVSPTAAYVSTGLLATLVLLEVVFYPAHRL